MGLGEPLTGGRIVLKMRVDRVAPVIGGRHFHDGSIATLPEAVKLMAKHQLGKNLTDDEVKSIVTFLGALKGDVNEDWKVVPELPPSGPTLAKADPN